MDTPSKGALIAANNTVEEIRRFVEADSLGYLSLASLRQAVDDRDGRYCYACYTGNYPTDLVQIGGGRSPSALTCIQEEIGQQRMKLCQPG